MPLWSSACCDSGTWRSTTTSRHCSQATQHVRCRGDKHLTAAAETLAACQGWPSRVEGPLGLGRQGQEARRTGGCLEQQGGAVKGMVASDRQPKLAGWRLAPAAQTQVLNLSSTNVRSDAGT